ncbi:ARID DNA-binding domain-containing protein [Tanacetum coccineum]
MVISKSFLERRWSRSSAFGLPNIWYQSKLRRPLRRRQQYDFIQRQLRREKEAQLGTCVRQITQDCKEMLRKKMEEIELYNSTINQPYSNNILQNRHKRYKCFKCRQRGHVMKNCPVKKHDEGKQETGNTSETAKEINEGFMTTKPTVSLKYPEWIHFSTKCMIKGTDQGHWDDIWLSYMFFNPNDHKFNEDKLRIMQNKFLENYFDSLEKGDTSVGMKTDGMLSVHNDLIEIKGTTYSTKDNPKVLSNLLRFPICACYPSQWELGILRTIGPALSQAPNKEAASTKGKEKIEHFGIILEDARRRLQEQFNLFHQNIKEVNEKQGTNKELITNIINSVKTTQTATQLMTSPSLPERNHEKGNKIETV